MSIQTRFSLDKMTDTYIQPYSKYEEERPFKNCKK